MLSRSCSLSHSVHECYFAYTQLVWNIWQNDRVSLELFCHFHVGKTSLNCYCDNFFDIVAAKLMLIVHAAFWHMHAKLGVLTIMPWLLWDFFLIFFSKDAPAVSIFISPQSEINDLLMIKSGNLITVSVLFFKFKRNWISSCNSEYIKIGINLTSDYGELCLSTSIMGSVPL